MPLATLAGAHRLLNIPDSDTTNDAEITAWITPAESILQQWHRAFSGTSTLPTTEQSLIFAEEAIVAWLFRRVREAPAVAQAFMDIAREAFNAYRDGTLRYPQAPGISPHESVSSSSTTGTGG